MSVSIGPGVLTSRAVRGSDYLDERWWDVKVLMKSMSILMRLRSWEWLKMRMWKIVNMNNLDKWAFGEFEVRKK